jgi:outer membrane cobalamin receptor
LKKRYRGTITLLRTMLKHKISIKTEVYSRIENCLNRNYEEPIGYQKPGILCVVGLKYTT